MDNIDTNNKSQTPADDLSDKEFLPTLLLCLFVGIWGVHRFYVGKVGTGIAMIFTFGGLGIWVLVDFIMICTGSFRDIDEKIIGNKPRVIVTQNSSGTGIAEELEKFAKLKEQGIISEEEFNKKKEELL
jgi:TM2 domain-containing membrane protein YozV